TFTVFGVNSKAHFSFATPEPANEESGMSSKRKVEVFSAGDGTSATLCDQKVRGHSAPHTFCKHGFVRAPMRLKPSALSPPPPRCCAGAFPASGTGGARRRWRERRWDRSARRQGCPWRHKPPW